MCGILARAGPSPLDPALPESPGWRAAMSRLHQRGPDSNGRWTAPSALTCLGHTRLAVNDLSDAGDQPMTDGSVAVTFNGEIYNAPDLRASLERRGCRFMSDADTEVLVHGYRLWGIDRLLEQIEGMFAFAIWDDEARQLHAAVDPTGQKPLLWAERDGSFYAASDADALRCILPHQPPLDYTGLCHMLCVGYCPAPRTVWRGVSKLAPGHAILWQPGSTARVRTYWSPPDSVDSGGRDDAEAFAALWGRVVADHLLSDVPVGLFLSGGIDSNCVAAALAETGHPIRCLTMALDSPDDESPAASLTADHLGFPHVSVPFGHEDLDETLAAAAIAYDEPQVYGALLTATRLARTARELGKVMLVGDGGDEAFAGYLWHQRPPCESDAPPSHFLSAYLRSVMPWFGPADAATLFEPIRDAGEPVYDEHASIAWCLAHDRPDLPWPRRAQRLDLLGFCAGSILPKIDRASMAVGLELRAPFLDRRVLEWALTRPVQHDQAAGTKPILRRYLRRRVPPVVLDRPKQGFSLRLTGTPWIDRLPRLTHGALARDVLGSGWRSLVDPGTPYQNARCYALLMMSEWFAQRF